MSTLLETLYAIINPVDYNRDKNRQNAKIMSQGMTLQELVEQSNDPYLLEDGVAEVFLDQIVSRLCYVRTQNEKKPFQK